MSAILCSIDQCTGCGACISICPKSAISFEMNSFACKYPKIDDSKCMECHLCENVCPSYHDPYLNQIQKTYAAWSLDSDTRINSASGGIASECYKFILHEGYIAYGVKMDSGKGAIFTEMSVPEDILQVRNSKYVYSSDSLPFNDIGKRIQEGRKVFFIGLPCQVDAVKRYLAMRRLSEESLLTCDLICHGVSPWEYLNKHIECVTKGKPIENIWFRDPYKGTQNYYFSLYDRHSCIYSRNAQQDDVYQLGYHRGLIYRENCYHCRYANCKRTGDLTLGDFSGLGKKEAFEGSKENVSCVLVNTEKGAEIISALVSSGSIYLEERPLEEATEYEHQLKEPSRKHIQRNLFEEEYKATGSFEASATKALSSEIHNYRKDKYSGKLALKAIARKLLSNDVRKKMKEVLYK